jgi:hypothetical protein
MRRKDDAVYDKGHRYSKVFATASAVNFCVVVMSLRCRLYPVVTAAALSSHHKLGQEHQNEARSRFRTWAPRPPHRPTQEWNQWVFAWLLFNVDDNTKSKREVGTSPFPPLYC